MSASELDMPGWVTRHGRDPRDAGEPFRIRRINPLAPVDAAVETPELGSAEGGQQVGEAVVVSHHVVLVVGERLPGLSGQMARLARPTPATRVTSIPPPLVVTILLPLNEKIPATPNEPAGRPRWIEPRAWPSPQ